MKPLSAGLLVHEVGHLLAFTQTVIPSPGRLLIVPNPDGEHWTATCSAFSDDLTWAAHKDDPRSTWSAIAASSGYQLGLTKTTDKKGSRIFSAIAFYPDAFSKASALLLAADPFASEDDKRLATAEALLDPATLGIARTCYQFGRHLAVGGVLAEAWIQSHLYAAHKFGAAELTAGSLQSVLEAKFQVVPPAERAARSEGACPCAARAIP